MTENSLNYGSYLQLDGLLNLQQPKSSPEEHDEMLFIVIHQSYELWFKQILHEFGRLAVVLPKGETWAAAKTLRRILTIMKTLVSQVDILETMTPLEFNSFRRFLASSSGFQSWQFRELEILCGLHSSLALKFQQAEPDKFARVQARAEQDCLWDLYRAYLSQRGHVLPIQERVDGDGFQYQPKEAVQDQLVKVLKSDGEASLISELLIDFDEGLQEWRYRHVKMVERTIGSKPGTGGSPGAAYLKSTLSLSVCPDLWAVRAKL